MMAKIDMNNGTVITMDGTPEEIADCYGMILRNVIELSDAYNEEDGEETEIGDVTVYPPDGDGSVTICRPDGDGNMTVYTARIDEESAINHLLDYILRMQETRNGSQDSGNHGMAGYDGGTKDNQKE